MEWYEGEPEKWEVGMIAVLTEIDFVRPEGWQQGDAFRREWKKPWLTLVGDCTLVQPWGLKGTPPPRPGSMGGGECEQEAYGERSDERHFGPVIVGWSPGFSVDFADIESQTELT